MAGSRSVGGRGLQVSAQVPSRPVDGAAKTDDHQPRHAGHVAGHHLLDMGFGDDRGSVAVSLPSKMREHLFTKGATSPPLRRLVTRSLNTHEPD